MDISKIKPIKKGVSDKYSWNLYRFLKKIIKGENGKYIKNQLEIHWLHHSRFDGGWLEFDPNNIDILQMLIIPFGIDNSRSFYSMRSVIFEGRAEHFALPWRKEDLTNVTDWFFETYIRDGRCIFDRKHNGWLLGDDNRFTYVNNTRKCNWCGKWQEKQIIKKQETKREVVWV